MRMNAVALVHHIDERSPEFEDSDRFVLPIKILDSDANG